MSSQAKSSQLVLTAHLKTTDVEPKSFPNRADGLISASTKVKGEIKQCHVKIPQCNSTDKKLKDKKRKPQLKRIENSNMLKSVM